MEELYLRYTKIPFRDPYISEEYFNEFLGMIASKTPLSDQDIDMLIAFLEGEDNDKSYFAARFLNAYRNEIPARVYQPALNAGLRYPDPHYNKSFFFLAEKIRGKEGFFNDLMDKIAKGSNVEKIQSIASLYWNFPTYFNYVGESYYQFGPEENLTKPVFRFFRKINPGFYLNANSDFRENRSNINRLLKILVNEFLSNENIIVRYKISDYLPRSLMAFPLSLFFKAKKVLYLIKKLGLPEYQKNRSSSFFMIWKKALENEELGTLFFDELKWRKRSDDIEKEILQDFQYHKNRSC